jgi:hypothetical protein
MRLWPNTWEPRSISLRCSPITTSTRFEIIADGRWVYRKAYDLAIKAIGEPKSEQHPTALHGIADALVRPWANE